MRRIFSGQCIVEGSTDGINVRPLGQSTVVSVFPDGCVRSGHSGGTKQTAAQRGAGATRRGLSRRRAGRKTAFRLTDQHRSVLNIHAVWGQDGLFVLPVPHAGGLTHPAEDPLRLCILLRCGIALCLADGRHTRPQLHGCVEINETDVPVWGDHHVAGLDIRMNDGRLLLMQIGRHLAELIGPLIGSLLVYRTMLCQVLLHIVTGDVIHNGVVVPIFIFDHIIYPGQILVL